MDPTSIIILDVAAIFVELCMFQSVFTRSNVFYDLSEGILLAGSAAFGLASYLKTLGTTLNTAFAGQFLLIIPVILGFLVFTRLTRYRWAARYSVAMTAGVGVGLVFGATIRTDILNQIITGVSAVTKATPVLGKDIVSALIMFVGALATISYFTYTTRFGNLFRKGPIGFLAKLGIVFLYISFAGGHYTINTPVNMFIDLLTRLYRIFGIA